MPTNEMLQLAYQFRQAVINRDKAALKRLTQAYATIYKKATAELAAIVAKLGPEGATPGQLQRMAQFKDLIKSIEQDVNEYGSYLRLTMRQEAEALIAQATSDANMMIARALGGGAELQARIKMLNPDVIKDLLGFLDEKSELWDYWREKAGKDTANAIKQAILERVGLGYNPKKLARDISPMLEKTLKKELADKMGAALTSALRTARTVQLWSYREASRANYAANSDVVTGWQWVAELDDRTCPTCIALHGRVFATESPMEGHWNCVTGDMRLVSPSMIDGMTRRRYDGEVIRIVTASGQNLTVTPNHPILTQRGWIGAQFLQDTDYCFRCLEEQGVLIDPQKDHVPATIEDVFTACEVYRIFSVPTTPEDFHGDGEEGKVDIIPTNRFLRHELGAKRGKPVIEYFFMRGNPIANPFPPDSLLDPTFFRVLSPYCLVTSESVSFVLFRGSLFHHEVVSFANGTDGTVFSDEDAADYVSGNPEASSDRLLRFPADVSGDYVATGRIVPDAITRLDTLHYSGHVYNLLTRGGWYNCNSIITHNCRCTTVPITVLSDPKSIEGAGEAWFAGLPPEQQKEVLGPAKYEAWKDGKLAFSQLGDFPKPDKVFGTMRQEPTLKELGIEDN